MFKISPPALRGIPEPTHVPPPPQSPLASGTMFQAALSSATLRAGAPAPCVRLAPPGAFRHHQTQPAGPAALEPARASAVSMFTPHSLGAPAQKTFTRHEVGLDAARQIVNWEARRDRNGCVAVYKPPKGDGGGSREVAGINDRYHPRMCAKLARMAPALREEAAAQYVEQYTRPAAEWTQTPAIEVFLRDTMFHRGPGGCAKILQRALGVDADGIVGPITKDALATAEKDPAALLLKLRNARESYEVDVVGVRPKFQRGLEARWNNAYTYASDLIAKPSPTGVMLALK